MTIFSKVWLFLLIVAAVPFFYMSARTLKTHQNWRTLYQTAKAKADRQAAKIDKLKSGASEGEGEDLTLLEDGKRQLKVKLDGLLKLRGRAWRNIKPGQMNAAGQVVVQLAQPTHGITPGLILYAFDQAPVSEGGEYIGDFRVIQVQEDQISLQPAQRFGPGQAKLLEKLFLRMQKSINRQGEVFWSLYDNMPVDSYQVFANVPEEELREILPPNVVGMYVHDGQEATPEDPEDRIVEVDGQRIYRRPLRDFQQIILKLDDDMFRLADEVENYQNRVTEVTSVAIPGATADEVYRDAEKVRLTADLAETRRELAAVEQVEASVRQELESLRAQFQSMFSEVKAKGNMVAQKQAKLLNHLNNGPATPRTTDTRQP